MCNYPVVPIPAVANSHTKISNIRSIALEWSVAKSILVQSWGWVYFLFFKLGVVFQACQTNFLKFCCRTGAVYATKWYYSWWISVYFCCRYIFTSAIITTVNRMVSKLFYFIVSSEINAYHQWIKVIFSQVKWYCINSQVSNMIYIFTVAKIEKAWCKCIS